MELGRAHVIDLAFMLHLYSVRCPYCGETFATDVDASAGNQEYIEDCYVCCRPIVFHISTNADGNLTGVEARRDDE